MNTNLIDVDLIKLIEQDLGPGRRYGRWTLFHCPFHSPDQHPSFGVTNGDERGPHWKCFSCGSHGGAIDWLVIYRMLTKKEAIQALSGEIQSISGYRPAVEAFSVPDYPPNEKWQERGLELVEWAEENLWGEKGTDFLIDWPGTNLYNGEKINNHLSAREWLLARGLTEQTLKTWRIGYIPSHKDKHFLFDAAEKWGLKGEAVVIAEGILIPCIIAGDIWYLKIRRPMPKPKKYSQVKGSRPALYMAGTLETHETVIFCEGELDALLLWQEAGDLTSVATLGSAGAAFSVATWGLYLINTKTRLIAYDADQAGQKGKEKLDWLHPKELKIPELQPFGKDLTDYFSIGGDLRSLVLSALVKSLQNGLKSPQEGLQGSL